MPTTLFAMIQARSKYEPHVGGNPFIWKDYLCLRQCHDDFQVDAMTELISDIGCKVACVDPVKACVTRTFTINESWATVKARKKLICQQNITDSKASMRAFLAPTNERGSSLWCGPIDSQKAQTRDPKDKDRIDGFVRSLPRGFAELNDAITEALVASCPEE